MSWLLPTDATVNPDVVSTPTPIMLETTTKIPIGSPKPLETGGPPGSLALVSEAVVTDIAGFCPRLDPRGAGGRLNDPERYPSSMPNHKCHKGRRFVNMVADSEQRPQPASLEQRL